MKHLYFLQTFCYMLLCAVGFTACSSDADDVIAENGVGYVSLALNADTGFKTTTKAVNESTYSDKNQYAVQIINSKNETVKEWSKYSEIEEGLIELPNGSYVLKAFYGEDEAASTTSMYVEGTNNFDINGDKGKVVSATCAPVCARVTITGEGMDEQFSDWSAIIKTKALSAKDASFNYLKNGDPVYLKVEKNEQISLDFSFTPKSGSKNTTASKSYTINPNEALNITLKPAASTSGKLGITITVNGKTDDKPIDIEIPSDWLN